MRWAGVVLGCALWLTTPVVSADAADAHYQVAKALRAQGRYEEALVYIKGGVIGQGQLLEPLFLAATLGQLGRVEEAAPVLDELRELWDRLCERAGCSGLDIDAMRREVIERWAVSESFADMLFEGLEKAGLTEA